MKKSLLKFSNLAVLCLILLIASCAKDSETGDEQASAKNLEELALIKEMGFDISGIEDMGTYYIVEGDIIIHKKNINSISTKQAYHKGSIISPQYQTRIYVALASDMPADWQNALSGAINFWNNIHFNSNIRLYHAGSSTPHITVGRGSFSSSNTLAQAEFPNQGKPGASVKVSINHSYMTSSNGRIWVLAHEIGHCLGFRHSNALALGEQPAAGHISGTPSNDATSIMYNTAPQTPTSLSVPSYYDRIATCVLYPISKPVVDLSLVSYDPSTRKAVVSAKCRELRFNWKIEGGGTIVDEDHLPGERRITIACDPPAAGFAGLRIAVMHNEYSYNPEEYAYILMSERGRVEGSGKFEDRYYYNY